MTEEPPEGDGAELPMPAGLAGLAGPPVRLNLPKGLQIGTEPCPECGSTIRPCRCEGGITPAVIQETARAMEADRTGSGAPAPRVGGGDPESPPKLAPEPQGPTGPYFAIVTYPLVGNPGVPDLDRGYYIGWVDDPGTAQQVARGTSRASRWSGALVRVSDRDQPRWEYCRGRRTHTYPVSPVVTFGEHATATTALRAVIEQFGAPAILNSLVDIGLWERLAGRPSGPPAAVQAAARTTGPAIPGRRPGVDPDETIEITQEG